MATAATNSNSDETTSESLRARLADQGVEHCMASYVDGHGVIKCKTVPIRHLEAMLSGSQLFTGAALDMLGQTPSDDELSVHPDPGAITPLPWRPTLAWAPGNLYLHGEPYEMCSRGILTRQVERARELGFDFNLGIEIEFYFVVRDEHGRPVPWNADDTLDKPCYDAVSQLESMSFLAEIVDYMETMGWDVHSFDHEDGNGQYEVDFAYSDAITSADRFTLFRLMAKEVARRHGYEATFMAKPFAELTGSGAHFNMSLASAEDGGNAFASDDDDARGGGLSELGYQFAAGLLEHAEAISAVTAPTVNSYKRLLRSGNLSGSTWAPVFISYGRNNRTHMLRVPTGSPRVESRAVDATVNPYLAAAIMLAAGLDGIERELDPGPPIDVNMYELSSSEVADLGVRLLPRNLAESVSAFEQSDLARRTFGESLHRSYVDFKQAEWEHYHNSISQWELDNYLTFF